MLRWYMYITIGKRTEHVYLLEFYVQNITSLQHFKLARAITQIIYSALAINVEHQKGKIGYRQVFIQ
jgi:hypothetical protein